MTVTFEQVKHGKSTYEISLSKLTGKKIVDLIGYPSHPFGRTDDATFVLTRVVFDDGTDLHLEGEHDTPYLTGLNGEVLNDLCHEINGE